MKNDLLIAINRLEQFMMENLRIAMNPSYTAEARLNAIDNYSAFALAVSIMKDHSLLKS